MTSQPIWHLVTLIITNNHTAPHQPRLETLSDQFFLTDKLSITS